MLRQKFGYETRVIRWIFLFLLLMNVFVMIVMLAVVPEEEAWGVFLTIGLLVPITVVFGLSPLLTRHEVHDSFIILRQGWYYSNRIDFSDIVSITKVRRGPWSYGVHLIGGGTIYANGRIEDLILIELSDKISRNGRRRRMTKVLFDTLENDAFVRMMGRRFDREVESI